MTEATQFPSEHTIMGGAPSRRNFLRTAGLAGGLYGLVQPYDVMAMAEGKETKIQQSVSEHARPTTHPADAHKLPRWTPKQTGPYNLSRPRDNHFAFAKVQANLAGEYTWLVQYGWVLMAPPGQPAYPFLGRVQISQVFVTPAMEDLAPGAGPDDYILWGTFTTLYVDPRTLEPVGRIMNPYTGKMIEPPVVEYADRLAFRRGKSIQVPGVDPKFYDQPWDRDGGYSQHFFDTGHDLSYTVLGSAQLPGPQQPRCDVSFWTSSREDVMNPSLASIDCRRDYSAIMKASEYAWYGVPLGDPAQLLVHLSGMKTQNPARLPEFIKPLILDRFKGRFII